MRKRSIFAAFALVSVSAIALLATACGDDDADASTDTSAGSAASQIASIQILDTIGLHAIDVAINDEKTVPATARTTMLKSAAILRSTEWPGDTAAAATDLSNTMIQLADALNVDPVDMARAGELAAKVHDDAHDLSHDVWAHLYEGADVDTGEDSHGD